ncbi:hypothetical protein [Mycobacterium sp. SA01]
MPDAVARNTVSMVGMRVALREMSTMAYGSPSVGAAFSASARLVKYRA